MNAQSLNRNITNIDFSKDITTFLHYNSNRCNGTSNKSFSENFRRNDQSEGTFKNSYYEDDFRSKLRNKSLDFNAYKLRYSSSHSSCSRYKERCNGPVRQENRTINNKVDQQKSNIKRNASTEAKVNFIRNDGDSLNKSTYCRPVTSLYNQQFLYKTVEKNAKLQRLVKELVVARQREKEKERWNNFIQSLKIKHGCEKHLIRETSTLYCEPEEFVLPEMIEDYYNTKFVWQNPCENLLHDFYNAHKSQTHFKYYEAQKENNRIIKSYNKHEFFETNSVCYPTSSQGRYILQERERQKRLKQHKFEPQYKTVHRNKETIVKDVDKENNNLKTNHKNIESHTHTIFLNSQSTNTAVESASTQTDSKMLFYPKEGVMFGKGLKYKHMVSKKICTEKPIKIKTVQANTQSSKNILKQNSLVCIEEKLDSLINSINNFIVENIKTKRFIQYNNYIDRPTKLENEYVGFTRSDSYSLGKKEKFTCGQLENSSRSTRNSSVVNVFRTQRTYSNLTKLNDILSQNIKEDKLITSKDSCVGKMYQPCSVQISVNISTKEISTEVTRSLFGQCQLGGVNMEPLESGLPLRGRRIAIAVNTDPLSFLALLKVSTEETIRKLMSFVPHIDYYYYLSRLQGPQLRAVKSHFACNICGAAFKKPSQLTDHIQKHELGRSRDCCVCRHVLDLPRRRPGLFKCQYCGQRFTRAYCNELHQQSCAARLGLTHDVASSLMLLT